MRINRNFTLRHTVNMRMCELPVTESKTRRNSNVASNKRHDKNYYNTYTNSATKLVFYKETIALLFRNNFIDINDMFIVLFQTNIQSVTHRSRLLHVPT